MHGSLQCPTLASRPMSEPAMRSEVAVAIDRVPQIVATSGFFRFAGLLRRVSLAGEVSIDQVWRQAVADDGLPGWKPDIQLAPVVRSCPYDRLCGELRLVNWRNRLRAARQPALDPLELRCVQRRQLHHRDPNLLPVVQQFRPERFAETLDRMFGGAVGGLQWNAPVRERRSDLNDDAVIARPHPLQRRQRAMDDAEV